MVFQFYPRSTTQDVFEVPHLARTFNSIQDQLFVIAIILGIYFISFNSIQDQPYFMTYCSVSLSQNLSILSKINVSVTAVVCREERPLSILSKINVMFQCPQCGYYYYGFQFYPRSTSPGRRCSNCIYRQLSILSKINIQSH